MDYISDDNFETLVRLSVRGDHDAFRNLFETLQGPLFGYVSARVAGREDAKDIIQDIFVDLWKALPKFSYSSEKGFYGFVYTITKRKIARHYRSRKKTVEFTEEIIREQYESDRGDTLLLLQTVRKLKPKYREVVELRYWSGMMFAEIAKMLGAKETTVKVRHHRAMGQLEQLLQNDYEK